MEIITTILHIYYIFEKGSNRIIKVENKTLKTTSRVREVREREAIDLRT